MEKDYSNIRQLIIETVTSVTGTLTILLKAIEATRGNISTQFLIESIVLTFIGGLVGIILGCLVAFFLNQFDVMDTSISSTSIILSFCVSTGIGVLFGYYPARKAAKLRPIEALKFE